MRPPEPPAGAASRRSADAARQLFIDAPHTEAIQETEGDFHDAPTAVVPGFGEALTVDIVAGPAKGRQMAIGPGQRVVVGRALSCDWVVADATVSRRHVTLTWHEGDILVEDLGSGNGVALNGQRVQQAVLSPGAVLKLGNTLIEREAAKAETEQAAVAVPPQAPVLRSGTQRRTPPGIMHESGDDSA